MARRVRQGRPERFDARIGDRAARGFDWTDGVDSILSWFVDLDGGALVEISLAMHPSAGRTGDSVRALAKPLLARVRWV
ncbi:MAG: hypothetical protein H6738_03850 [Alphaproteobacteria bacterium]|nr:hypothetical protein [Alphaproteobacteria bacterium]MCB9695903.1 hypothetical protein [Alphaproteobacteria bacterium]